MKPGLLLRARLLVPVSRPAIQDGAVLISGNRIQAIGRWRDLSSAAAGESRDLGDVLLLPGLVNAHCHLDYTSMAGLFPPPKSFTDWIKSITATKAEWSYSDFAESWLKGAKMLVRTGTTTVGDIETLPELLPEVWEATPLRVLSFLEMTGVKGRREPRAVLRETVGHIKRLANARCLAGLSPHAPYSTLPQLLRLSAEIATERAWRLCTHVAESALEYEMFAHGRGEMFDWLRRSQRDMSDCGLGSPIEHLERYGLLKPNLLAVHVNYLGKHDAGRLGKHNVNVVHCPRSHAYFRHDPFPLKRLLDAKVNVALGTDSLASVWKRRKETVELNMFEEMRAFARTNLDVSPKIILRMSTTNGAQALGMTGKVGEIADGCCADLITIPFAGKTEDAYETVLDHDGPVHGTMIDGQWITGAKAADYEPQLNSA